MRFGSPSSYKYLGRGVKSMTSLRTWTAPSQFISRLHHLLLLLGIPGPPELNLAFVRRRVYTGQDRGDGSASAAKA